MMNITSKRTLEKIKPEDRADVLKIGERTKQDFNELIQILNQAHYPKTHAYLKIFQTPFPCFSTGGWKTKNGYLLQAIS